MLAVLNTLSQFVNGLHDSSCHRRLYMLTSNLTPKLNCQYKAHLNTVEPLLWDTSIKGH